MSEETNKNIEISEEQLENVSGGSVFLTPGRACPQCRQFNPHLQSGKIVCSKCGCEY